MESKRAKTARGRRILARREPQLVENPKRMLVLRGQKTSALVNDVLRDLFMMGKPHSVHFKRHNAVHPFEDITPLEFLAQKNDTSLFAFGTHSKKRPHHLVLGRMFDSHLLDMYELAIQRAQSMAHFVTAARGGASAESKPLLLFHGEWENSPTLASLKGLLLDFFLLQRAAAISPIGIERVVVFTASSGGDHPQVLLRHYAGTLKKSAEGTSPFVDLREIGPSIDLQVRRVQQPAPELLKEAMRHATVSSSAPKKTKNVTHSKLAGRQGRLHVPRQDLSSMATAKMKGLRPPKRAAKASAEADGAAARKKAKR